jgi:hypothetical protein
MAFPPNPRMRNPYAKYWTSAEQQKLINDAALTLPDDQRQLFRLRVSKILRDSVHGSASDASVRLAIGSAKTDVGGGTRSK